MIVKKPAQCDLGAVDGTDVGPTIRAHPNPVQPPDPRMAGHHGGQFAFHAVSSTMLNSRSAAPLAWVRASW